MAYQTNSNTTKCSGNYIFDCPSDKRIFAGKRRDLDIFFQLFAWVRHDELRRSKQVKVAGLPVKSRIQWFPRKFILYPDTCTFCCFDSEKLFNPKSNDACQSNLHKQIEESTSLRFTNKKLTTIRVTTRPVDPRVEPRQMEKKGRMKSQSELSK